MYFYEEAIKICPEDSTTYNNIANLHLVQNNANAALKPAQKAVELDPNNAELLLTMGWIYKELGRYDSALLFTQKSLEFNPESTAAHNNLGVIQKEIGKTSGAISATLKSIDLDPGNHQAFSNLKEYVCNTKLTHNNKQIILKAYEILLSRENVSHRKIQNIF